MTTPVVTTDGCHPALSEPEIEQMLAHAPFCALDLARFPTANSLPAILARHARLLRCEPGDLILREGDYGNSAFVVL
jgi:hypothetical protein